jgi:hypothetical protein
MERAQTYGIMSQRAVRAGWYVWHDLIHLRSLGICTYNCYPSLTILKILLSHHVKKQ